MIDLRLLDQAITLARYGNFARAAEALHLTQPTLSRSIASLEAALGERLFDRAKQGVQPTAFGEMLLTRGRALLEGAHALERDFRMMRGLDGGEVRVACGPFPTAMSVSRAIGRLLDRHPRLRVELITADLRRTSAAVLDSTVDFGVLELSVVESDTRLATEKLPQHPMMFYCRAGHPLLGEKDPTIERILEFPLVATRLAIRATGSIMPIARAGCVDPQTGDYLPPVKVESIHAARDVVLDSDAVSAAPLCTIALDLEDGRIGTLAARAPWLHTSYGFAKHRDATLSPMALALMDEIRSVEREIVSAERKAAARGGGRSRARRRSGR